MTKWERLNDPEAAEIYIASLEADNRRYLAWIENRWHLHYGDVVSVYRPHDSHAWVTGATPAEALDAAIERLKEKK